MVTSSEQAALLASRGRVDDAAQLLIRASQAGEDADALVALATWRIQGNLIRRDLAEARTLLARAAAAGRSDARLLHAFFLANGTGGDAEWQDARTILAGLVTQFPQLSEQVDLASRLPVDELGDPIGVPAKVRLSEAPAIWSAEHFLSAEECGYLIGQSEGQLRPSFVIDRATGRPAGHPDRKCESMVFGVTKEDLMVSAIRRRVAAFAGVGIAQTEPLQIIRYRPGDEFRPHFDSVAAGENQRIMTALVYLTDRYQGGETRFTRAGLNFRGRRGEVLLFRNADDQDLPDSNAEHAGLPVASGTKIVLSCWIRARPYAFPPPAPASRRF